ncbi:MAG: nucleotidyltransferase family protein [Candidatus Binatia bacterium]
MPAVERQRDDVLAAARRGLLLALHPDPTRFADWVRAHGEGLDWAWIVRTAGAHKVAALLAARVEASGVGEIVGATLGAQLADVRRDAAARAALAEHTLARIAATFGAAAIPFFVVKGSLLSHRVYGDARLRRFADVDVVVHRVDVARAEAALTTLGYYPGGIEEILAVPPKLAADQARAQELTRRFHARQLAAFSWYPPRGNTLLPVDLHWHVAPARLRVSEAALWSETTATRLDQTELLTFTPAATLVHLAAHATTSLFSGFRLMHLCDVGWAAGAFSAHEPALWQLAERWRVRQHMMRVFALVEGVLEIEMPSPPLARHRGDRGVAAAAGARFLLDAPSSKTWPLRRRLWPELRWGVAMRSMRRNVAITAAVSWARLRFKLAR